MEQEVKTNPQVGAAIGQLVQRNTQERGKQQNRVTGSGGMLLGRVLQIGSRYNGPLKLKVGDTVATLVSLTLTPLQLDAVHQVNLKTHQISVSGHAILLTRECRQNTQQYSPRRRVGCV